MQDAHALEALGWNDAVARSFAALERRDLEPARVLRVARGMCRVLGAATERDAQLAGRFLLEDDPEALPAVGDWVAVSSAGLLERVLPRASAFRRRAAGEELATQVVAANVDVVLLLSGLDADLNVRRIERYLALASVSGAAPVVVLNKADLCGDVEAAIAAVRQVAGAVPVVALSARTGAGLEALAAWLVPRRTLALLGSSGVGKSTLVNRLLGEERMKVAEVREHDGRGRHTTTTRELVILPSGALLVDTPGMREIGMLEDADALREAFADVAELASGCRFRDCRHDDEPGCAVTAAAQRGALDPPRLASYRKLRAELEAMARMRRQKRRERPPSGRPPRKRKR
jgi:ribosome biogenesis GTPase / thiamine phosphate phosphatase